MIVDRHEEERHQKLTTSLRRWILEQRAEAEMKSRRLMSSRGAEYCEHCPVIGRCSLCGGDHKPETNPLETCHHA